jgi:hypothetical protein
MYSYRQRVGQTTVPSSLVQSSSVAAVAPAPGTLAAAGYTADQGAEIGVAVSALPLVGLLLGAVALSALSPSDAIPQWAWAVIGGGVGLALGNQLGLAAVNAIVPANPPIAGVGAGAPSSSFNETAFYQQMAQTASTQLQSYFASLSASTAPASTAPAITTPTTS